MVYRQSGAHGGVIQPVTPGFGEGIADLAVFITVTCPSQFVGADNVEAVAGEIQILIGQLFARRDVEHH